MKSVHPLFALLLFASLILAGCTRQADKEEPAPRTDELAEHDKKHDHKDGHAHADHKHPTGDKEAHAHKSGAESRGKHGDAHHSDKDHKKDHKDHKDHGPTPGSPGVKVGDKVPDISIKMLDGKSIKLSELREDEKRTTTGVVVLSFWCTTCHSCRHVETHLGKLAKDYEGKAVVMALDANSDDPADAIIAFIKKTGLTLPVAIDPSGGAADVFGIRTTTTTVVIDGDGRLRYCGQFRQKGGASAEDAVRAVLAGNEVAVKTTPHHG